MNKTAVVVVTGVAMLVAFVLGARIYQSRQAENVAELAKRESTILEPAHAMTWGPDDARVTVVEFFDPACETCAAMAGRPRPKARPATAPSSPLALLAPSGVLCLISS